VKPPLLARNLLSGPTGICFPNRRQFIKSLTSLSLLSAGCVPVQSDRTLVVDDWAISLGSKTRIQAALVSDRPDVRFTVSGLEENKSFVLPRTSIARVILPPLGITIEASAPCFRKLEQFVQAGSLPDGGQIAFAFSNLDRLSDCNATANTIPSIAQAFKDPARFAWVIGNSAYTVWPSLGAVAADREAMMMILRQASYNVTASADSSRVNLVNDGANFRALLAHARPRIAIVYLSGHGVSLNGKNYVVPIDAPDVGSIRPEDLFAVEDIVQILSSVRADGGCALVLVDACRANTKALAQPFTFERSHEALVNYSTAPGGRSYDSERGMSAWTEQFVTVAGEFPNASIDQILGYANRYTFWQSQATQQPQVPVLYGEFTGPLPSFSAGSAPLGAGELPHLTVRNPPVTLLR
jgi:hypothetical protein